MCHLIVLLLFTACNTAGERAVEQNEPVADTAALDRSEWWLSRVRLPRGDFEKVEATMTEPPVHLEFFAADDVRNFHLYEGFTGCTSFGGEFDLGQPQNFEEPGTVEGPCPAELTQQDEIIPEVIENASALQLSPEGMLEVVGGDGEISLVYTPEPKAPVDPALGNTEWELVTLRGKPVLAGTVLTIAITEASSGWWIGGLGGCNEFYGEIRRLDEGVINVPKIFWTDGGCEGAIGRQESAYFHTLRDDVAGYHLDGQRLELLNATGEVVGVLRKAPE